MPLDDDLIPEPGPTRETLLVQVEALRGLVERQKRYIDSMRASRFWRLRDLAFALQKRRGIPDPLPVPTTEEIRATAVALGDPYQLFRAMHRRSPAEQDDLAALTAALVVTMPIQLVIVVDSLSAGALNASLASLAAQCYPHWIAQILTEDPDLLERLRTDLQDQRYRFGSEASVLAPLIGSLRPGDLLEADALLWPALSFHNGADVVYTDNDVLDGDGIPSSPTFKPDWSPETALTRNYVGDLCIFRSDLLGTVWKMPTFPDAKAWYEALLLVSEHSEGIVHIPRVLYHRGCALTDPTPCDVAITALARRGEVASATKASLGCDIRFAVQDERVTIVIPTRDQSALLERCLTSLFDRTSYSNFDVVIIDNGSEEAATAEVLRGWQRRFPERFRVISDPLPFNYSRLNNLAVRSVNTPFVVLLNNDVEVIAPKWLERMLGQARRASIGAVGGVLLYEDGTVQHAGVILGGVLDLAGHAYRFLSPEAAIPALHLDTNYLAVTGACLMVSREKYDEVGGLDESLEVSYNDIDFCLKLRARGYRNVVVPSARMYHFESKTRGRDDNAAKVARAAREARTVAERWPQWAARDPYYNPNLTLRAEDFSVRL